MDEVGARVVAALGEPAARELLKDGPMTRAVQRSAIGILPRLVVPAAVPHQPATKEVSA
jgi:hypothetical protein